jgi:hypothetical protein
MSTEINEKDMIDAFKDSLAVKDKIKARVILTYIEAVSKKVQKRLLFELVRSDLEFQLPLLIFLLDQHQSFCQSFKVVEETLIAHAIDYPDHFANVINTEEINNPSLVITIAEKAKETQQVFE